MELQINNNYRVRTDELNVMLEKRRVAQKGKSEGTEVWETVGYYPEFEWALREMLRRGILQSDLYGVKAIVDAIEVFAEDVKKALSESNIKRLDKQMRKLAMENELLRKKLDKLDKEGAENDGNYDQGQGPQPAANR